MAQFATVAAITGTGTVLAVDLQGRTRVLKVGDTLQKGETVRTVGDVRVELLMEDGSLLAVAPAQSVRLDENVVQSDQRPTAQDSAVTTPATADTVIQALERGTDLNQSLEATAAGLAPGGGVDGGSSFVQLLRITEGVTPLAYEYNFVPPELQPDIESIPEPVPPTASVGVTVGVQVGVGEGGPGLVTGDMVQGSVSTANVLEGSGGGGRAVTFLITLNQVSTTDVTITYTIVPGTASNPEDYFDGAPTGTVTIPAGYIGFFVTENIVGDTIVEANETFTIVLSNPIGATLINDTATVTIIDDDVSITAQGGQGDESDGLVTLTGALAADFGPGDTGTVSLAATGATWNAGSNTLTADNGTWQVVVNSGGTYTFTQLSAFTHSDPANPDDPFDIQITATATDDMVPANSNTTTFTITVDDDGPTAVANSNNVNEGATLSVNAAGGVLANDTAGADGYAAGGGVVGVRAAGGDTTTAVTVGVNTSIIGLHGTLTLQADGSYTYQSDANDISGAETDVFVYTIKDGDGDLSTTTLTINLADSGLVAPADNDVLVNESALDTTVTGADIAAGTVTGSLPGSTAETDATNQLNATGGFGTLTYALDSSATGTYGTIQINSDGTYVYTLTQPFDTSPDANNGTNTEDNKDFFTYRVTDANGNTTTGTITVDIIDDVPVVLDKTDLIYSNSSPGGTGIFDYTIGADSRTTFSSSNSDFSTITLAGMVGAAAISTPSVTWASEDLNEAVFDVQFFYAANPLTPGVLTEANGTLTFDKVSGTYELTLDEPIESFSILTTSGTLSKESYNLVGPSEAQPEIVVSQLADEFFVRFTGGEEQGGGGVEFKSSDGTEDFNNGETFVGAQTWVSISGGANGVASDTLQAGEVLNMDFYTSSPGNNPSPSPGTATANGIYLKLDQLGVGEDFVVILKLVDADNPLVTTTRAIVIDYADIYLSSESNPYGITFADGSDGVVIIESNDYNSGGSNWVINGAQLLVSTETVTGEGIDLNRATGDTGGSTVTETFGGDTVDNDVIKITDIGFISTTTDTQDASLDFTFTLVDADGDTTATQTLNVTIEGSSTFEGTASAESITGDGSANVLIGGGGNDILEGGGGADVFKWSLGDQSGTPGTPAADVVTDFAAGDTLNLLDLLPGAPGTDLSQYLHVTQETGGIMIHVTDGTGTDSAKDVQTILLASYTTTDTVTDILNELKATQQYTG
ncbi:MAG: retention module-containing protein [Polaromonas sp.]|uniref:retention module-containing protein n=1 Tax=Polaromonas sp. TaxID=1869339 RepID=UPI0027331998|nr:retention module-containing protein [Polaromonas sp.]MDP3796146.1 retention module-containing protein [Polaromonas sp.]